MTSDHVLGIDLGTTNSAVATSVGDEVEILPNREGNRITPSVVRYPDPEADRSSPFVGETARNKAVMRPDRTVQSIKRHVGSDHTVEIDGEDHPPKRIEAEIVRKLREDAAEKLGVPGNDLTDAVITVPAYFAEDSRQATRDAARIAGFDDVTIVNEPTAAAMAYGFREDEDDATVVVYDLGGGTFDVSVMDIGHGRFEVQATNGDRHLGGDDWDDRLLEHVAAEFEAEHGVNPLDRVDDEDPAAVRQRKQRLLETVREAKERLANQGGGEVDVTEMFLMEHEGERLNLDQRLDDATVQSLTDDLLERTVGPTLDAVEEAGYGIVDVDEVLLVGGATRMSQVEEKVTELFDTVPDRRVSRDEAVAVGAALHGNRSDLLLQEVTPLTLGIRLQGDVFEPIVERNTTLPAEGTKTFTTSQDNQTAIEIDVYQGEREIASENRKLRTFYLTDIPPAPRGIPQVEVTFRVDRNGLITARARDGSDATGTRSREVTVEGATTLSEDEIESMVREAERARDEDRKRRELIEQRNESRRSVDRADRYLDQYAHLLDGDEATEIERAAADVRAILDDDRARLADLESATETLADLLMRLGERIHSDDRARPDAGVSEADDGTRATDPMGTESGTSDGGASTSEASDPATGGRSAADGEPATGAPDESTSGADTDDGADPSGDGSSVEPDAEPTPAGDTDPDGTDDAATGPTASAPDTGPVDFGSTADPVGDPDSDPSPASGSDGPSGSTAGPSDRSASDGGEPDEASDGQSGDAADDGADGDDGSENDMTEGVGAAAEAMEGTDEEDDEEWRDQFKL